MNCVKFNVGYEDIISRIPGLFAYGEFDEFDEYKLHKATDSPNGCYGKIVENIKINASLKIDGEIILDNVIKSIVDENGNERIISGIYSYRQIMDCYYQYLNQRDKSPLFFEFVEKGIGKKKIEGFDRKINDLVPEYVYLANARSLYNQYVKLNKMCQFYKNSGEKNTDLCCLCEKFERMGGNRMITILEQMIDEAINVADEYYSYCEFERLPLKINFNICLSSSENDMGMLTPYVEEWEAGKKYYEGDIFHYDGKTYKVKNGREFKGIWNDETLRIEFYDYSEETPKISVDIEEYDINTYDGTNNETNELSGYTDSKLQSLRRYKEYLNLNDETEFPDKGKDWLFFYRKNLVLNVRTLNDNLGNIQHIGSDMTNGNDLYAYGDAITDITVNKSERTITFEYWLDAHLNASYTDYEVDDDGNHIYHFSDFRIDDSVNHGIKYTETYTYDEGSELDEMILSNNFNDYINGNLDNETVLNKYEFNLMNSVLENEKRIDFQKTKVPYNITRYTANLKTFERQKVFLFRHDYYNGVTYQPKKDIDVYVDRGITAAFEKHINFSCVKTLDSMIEFSNGSFFKMINDN